jgi:hypothetical protein
MAAYVKFHDFVEQLCKGVHQLHAAGHTLKAYLSNATPDQTLDTVKADLAEIAGGNGYTAGGADTQNDLSESTGTATLTAVDITWTASGAVGPFRYVAQYNDTPASPADPLVNYWDYGSSISLASGETFTVNYGASYATVA